WDHNRASVHVECSWHHPEIQRPPLRRPRGRHPWFSVTGAANDPTLADDYFGSISECFNSVSWPCLDSIIPIALALSCAYSLAVQRDCVTGDTVQQFLDCRDSDAMRQVGLFSPMGDLLGGPRRGSKRPGDYGGLLDQLARLSIWGLNGSIRRAAKLAV